LVTPRNSPTWLVGVLLLCLGFELNATELQWPAHSASPARTPTPLDPAGIEGTLILVGGGTVPKSVWQRFRQQSPGDDPQLIVIPTAQRNPQPTLSERQRQVWAERGFSRVEVFHAESAREADGARAAELLADASAVWIQGGNQSRVIRRYLGTETELLLREVLQRGGVIGGTSAGAAVMSRVMIAGGRQPPRLATGFDWLPDAVVDQHFTERQRTGRLQAALELHPARWGVGIDEGTALSVEGRRLNVLGSGGITICLAKGEHHEAVHHRMEAGSVGDLTAWRRAARQRVLSPFPPSEPAPPLLPAGTLVIAGGGDLPRGIVARFLELAGGPEARIVVLPTSMPDPLPTDRQLTGLLRRAGARNLTVLRDRDRDAVETDRFVAEIDAASGIWLAGGRQWRFVDAYEGTRAQEALYNVLRRGGVIGGSSAGATIQAEYLVRGNPLGNHDMMAQGYERGFGFLPGTAIDQHLTQRNRLRDLAPVIERYPQLLGIGIDEETALVVQGHVGEVLGRGAVYFFESAKTMATSVTAGGRYDLKARRREETPRLDTATSP
jgi:cyanophycinase